MATHLFNGVAFETKAPLDPIEVAELDFAEQKLGCHFPTEYRDFVLRFGSGEFNELSLRIFAPRQVVEMTSDDRARLAEYWFWVDSPDIWNRERAIESIACFDGSNGDDLRFHPSDPQTLYLLPHEESVIYKFSSLMEIVRHFRRECEFHLDKLTFTPDRTR
jgi:hypothetical protein